MIRMLLVDDHRLPLAGLQSLLEVVDEVEVVGAASDGLEAVALARKLSPQVVLMDLSMPGWAAERPPAT